MIRLHKYDKNGKCDKYEFNSLVKCLAFLYANFKSSEWCWVFYGKDF